MKKMRTLLALTILWTCDKNVNRLMLQSHEGKQLLDTGHCGTNYCERTQ